MMIILARVMINQALGGIHAASEEDWLVDKLMMEEDAVSVVIVDGSMVLGDVI